MDRSKPYTARTDLEKLQSQWNKIGGLQQRKDWSAAIVRAATAAELAANFAIRKEFETRSKFDPKGVDKLLFVANGLNGKIDRLLLPLLLGTNSHQVVQGLKKLAEKIYKDRNAIIHQGEFRNEEDLAPAIENTKKFVETLVGLYEDNFSLKGISSKGKMP